MRRFPIVPTLLLVVLNATMLDAQRSPTRPTLPPGADPNEWEAYYDLGVELLNRGKAREAWSALHWAARVNPARAEPPFALSVALLMQDIGLYQRSLEDVPEALRDPRMVRADSLRREAFARSPFVPRTLDVLVADRLPYRWRDDRRMRPWLRYALGEREEAARLLADEVEADPRGRYRQRYDVALMLVGMGRMDSAAVQVQALLDELRRRDEAELVRVYESKDMLEYALGLLHLARGRHAEARAAMERALVENAAARTAHRGLGLVAQAEGKHGEAAEHFGQAVELAGERPLFVYEHGRALSTAGRAADAVPVLARVVEAEPFWPEAQLELGRAHDRARNAPEALKAYERYLQLAPRKASSVAQSVRQRMEQLRAAAGGS